jgi:AraC-like DNA-binding protein
LSALNDLDIKMEVQNIAPNFYIASHVDRILVLENKGFSQPFTLPLYANGVPTLLYISVQGKVGERKANHLTLFGQTVLPEKLTLTEDFMLIAYFFKPYCLLPLFGIEGHELTDNPLDVELISNAISFCTLKEKLLYTKDASMCVGILNDYIYQLINRAKEASPLLTYAATTIYKNYSKDVLATLQKELRITERSFERLFHKGMGINPSTYRRICQFNAAFFDLNLGNYKNLSDIAFNHGYTDQSHYIRAFKEFTSITPADYLKFQ